MMGGPGAGARPARLCAASSSKGMLMARSALFAGLGALALAGLALTGCSSTPAAQPESSQSVETNPDLGAAWLDNGRLIGLVTLGSSTCIPVSEHAELSGDVLQVTLAAPETDQVCTRDLVPRVTLVTVPEDADPEHDLQIEVTGDHNSGRVDLPGVAGLAPAGETDYNPSAGWATTAGQFVILTWGSSTCVPVLEDVAASGPAEVTVTYQTEPDNQVCTMDMVGRAAVTAVNDLTDASDVQLILTGGGFDNVKVPIYGSNSAG